MAEERDRLRTTFDEAASLYDEVRPGYPDDLFDDIVSLSLFWNVHVHSDASGGFFEATQRIYEREAPEIVGPEDYKGLPRPHEVLDRTEEIQDTGYFGSILTRHYRWDETYDAEGYLRVLSTYSGHRSLNDDTRKRLFRGIADLIDDGFDGRIVKGYLTTLYVAKRN